LNSHFFKSFFVGSPLTLLPCITDLSAGRFFSVLLCLGLLVSGCTPADTVAPTLPHPAPSTPLSLTSSSRQPDLSPADEISATDEIDTECSYFYFLWGRYAEVTSHFAEALEAYEKAIICDPQAEYIVRKLPLIYLRLHRDKKAIAELNAYLQRHPDDTFTRMLLAKVFIHNHQYDRAAQQYEYIHRHDPGETRSLLLLSELYISRQQPGRAINVLQEVLSRSPDNYAAHVLLARIYVGRKDIEKAVQQYTRALVLNRTVELEMELGELYLQQKRYTDAQRLYTQIISRQPENEEAGMALVHVYLLQNKEKKALAELNRLKTISYNSGMIDMAIARLYARKKNYVKAAAILQELVSRENSPRGRYMLAILLLQLKKYEDALFQLTQIPATAAEYEDGIFLRVRILRLLQRPEDAISILEKILSGEENGKNNEEHKKEKIKDTELYALLARLYQAQGKTELGRKTFARVLRQYPNDENLLYEYGLFLDQAGDRKKAMTIMQKVIALQPSHAAALNYVGYTWADHRQHLDKALTYIRRAVQLKPKNGYIRDSLGWIYYRLGRLQEAKQELLQAVKLAPDDPAILDHLGDVYLESGQQKKALQVYQQALKKFTKGRGKLSVEKKIHLIEQHLTGQHVR